MAVYMRKDDLRAFIVSLDGLRANQDGVRDRGDVPIDMHCQIDLCQVAILQGCRLGLQRREVADEVVHGDATRKRNSLLDLYNHYSRLVPNEN